MDSVTVGSTIAKQGFENEERFSAFLNQYPNPDTKIVIDKLNLGKEVIKIESQVLKSRFKTDVSATFFFIDESSIVLKFSIKKSKANFNQLDRRSSSKYKEIFCLDDKTHELLSFYCGDKNPSLYNDQSKRSPKRMFINEFTKEDQEIIINFLESNKAKIFDLGFKGNNPEMTPDYMVSVSGKNSDFTISSEMIHILPINEVITKYFGDGKVSITKQGNIKIGNLTIQRKGGDGGKPTANDIQIKIKPSILTEVTNEEKAPTEPLS